MGGDEMNGRECLRLLTGLAAAALASEARAEAVDNPARLFKFS